jgi:aspartate beta-hydroxylase
MMQNFTHQPGPDQQIQQALLDLQEDRPAEARAIFDSLIKSGTVNASIWLGMAYACRALGDGAGLLNAVDKSLELEERNPRAHILRADHFFSQGDLQAAASFYLKGLNMAPPPAQTPSDLRPELERARERYDSITKGLEEYLLTHMIGDIDEAGVDARRVKYSLDFLTGKSQPYFQQPKTYFFPELANLEFADPGDFAWVEDVEAATDDIRQELLNIIEDRDGFEPYVAGIDNRPESDPHNLKNNKDWSALYLWRSGELIEKNAALFPKTLEVMKKLPFPAIDGQSPNILFSLLRAGSKIPPHNGKINTRLICHLPLIVPPKCGFRVGNDTREWEEGKVWIFDDTMDHEAWNDSTEDRYILLFEVWRPELTSVEKRLVSKLMTVIDNYRADG